MRNQFEEELDLVFKRAGYNRIRTLDPLAIRLHAQRGVLSRLEAEVFANMNADHPQVGREVDALCDSRMVKLVVRSGHLRISRLRNSLDAG